MAPQLSPFDLLPDEVVVQILEGVGTRNAEEIEDQTFTQVCFFLWASSVCPRFRRLARTVKSVDWNLGTQEEAVSLMNFLLRQEVSLSRLHLNASVKELKDIPIPFLFSAPFQEKVPSEVTVSLEIRDDESLARYSLIKSPELGLLMERVLACRNLESLSLVNQSTSYHFAMTGCDFPSSNVRELYLKEVLICSTDIENIFEQCQKLETAVFAFDTLVGSVPDELDLISESVLNLVIRINDECPPLRLHTPSLVSLEANVELWSIAAPNLQHLKLEVDGSVFGPPAFTGPAPSLKHLSLGDKKDKLAPDIDCDYWGDIVRPLLVKFECLERLELGWSEHKPWTDPAVVAFDQLILDLPLTLGSLLLVGNFLDVLGYPETVPPVRAKSCVTTLQVDVHQVDYPSFSKLRSLRVALLNPNLSARLRYTNVSHDSQTGALFEGELGYKRIR